VAAHGSLNPAGGAFQVVSDEGKLAVSAGDLARSLHNVGVVILFVCSGGRTDKHPASDATMGLARDVLDQGAQAVIASPWPLDSLVPPYWLPTFLRHWEQGDTVATSVHSANRYLYERSGNNTAQGLAMTVMETPTCGAER
jgi:CHAT domain-containing protein